MGALSVALGGVVITMAMALLRATRGPTLYDRILAANTF